MRKIVAFQRARWRSSAVIQKKSICSLQVHTLPNWNSREKLITDRKNGQVSCRFSSTFFRNPSSTSSSQHGEITIFDILHYLRTAPVTSQDQLLHFQRILELLHEQSDESFTYLSVDEIIEILQIFDAYRIRVYMNPTFQGVMSNILLNILERQIEKRIEDHQIIQVLQACSNVGLRWNELNEIDYKFTKEMIKKLNYRNITTSFPLYCQYFGMLGDFSFRWEDLPGNLRHELLCQIPFPNNSFTKTNRVYSLENRIQLIQGISKLHLIPTEAIKQLTRDAKKQYTTLLLTTLEDNYQVMNPQKEVCHDFIVLKSFNPGDNYQILFHLLPQLSYFDVRKEDLMKDQLEALFQGLRSEWEKLDAYKMIQILYS